ncbi:TLC domain-containing protein [Biscogniauxia mediterranea]|nr:TLC domain-containing protein [Biscogniauxia mediterranea]
MADASSHTSPKASSPFPTMPPHSGHNSSSSNSHISRKASRKGDNSLIKRLANTTGFSLNLVAVLFLLHNCLPQARPYTSKFLTLSQYNPDTGNYAVGDGDFYFVAFWVVLLTGLRAGCMEFFLARLAKTWGISKKKQITRFCEQAWMLMYYSVSWPLGVYIYYKSSHFLDLRELWTNWPQRELDGLTKAYVLVQWAFWLHQVLVINIEARRKDHWQMLTHHLVTILLIATSYAYHLTRVGTLIMITMDVVDLVFPLAKCLKYLGFNTACDILFGVFVVTWLFSRHVVYPMICWSVYSDLPQIITPSCYKGSVETLEGPFDVPDDWSHLIEPFRDTEGLLCFNDNIMLGFLAFLLVLQGMMVIWSFFIIRVTVRVLKGENADDPRSDDEEAGDEEKEMEMEMDIEERGVSQTNPIEEEVGVEELNLKEWERRKGSKRAGGSTAVGLPGHSDCKEILNRIGCEKKID